MKVSVAALSDGGIEINGVIAPTDRIGALELAS
jgi:hypothetical protein